MWVRARVPAFGRVPNSCTTAGVSYTLILSSREYLAAMCTVLPEYGQAGGGVLVQVR